MDLKKHLSSFLNKEEFDRLMSVLNEEPIFGLRLNKNKLNATNLLNYFPKLKKHPLVKDGFYSEDFRVSGNHPLHHAGAFYIQEPSAMVVGELLNVNEDDKVIDISAAPGGKTTQVALKLSEGGLMIANDINYNRAKVLSENVERLGIENAYVTSNDIDELVNVFSGYFDKVIFDAPCSMSGMFRKNEATLLDWSYDKVLKMQLIQKEVIVKALKLLKTNGTLIYSTCSFSKEENEDVINYVLENNYASLIDLPNFENINRGIKMNEALRLYPFNFKGEGHFIALLKNKLIAESKPLKMNKKPNNEQIKLVLDFFNYYLNSKLDINRLFINNNHVHYLPKANLTLKDLHLLRSGLHLGEIKKDRFEPSHALAISSLKTKWKNTINFKSDSDEIFKYLKGESFKINSDINGYALILVDGISIGYAKIVNNTLKNHYPKGLRIK